MAKIKISLITWLLISFASVSYSQSGWVNYSPNSYMHFCSVKFINENTGYVLDWTGYVLKTTNAGVNWTQTIFLSCDVNDIDFVNDQTGYICGDTSHSILKTINGGYNWQVNALFPAYLTSIHFISIDTGFAVGYSGYILKTTNGGVNWNQLPSQQSNFYTSIDVLNSSTLFISGSRVLRSSDGGINWMDISPEQANSISLFFIDENTGIVLGYYNQFRTTDAGLNWNQIINDNYNYTRISFSSETTGYVCGPYGRIIKTTNTGLNWYPQISGVTTTLTGFCFTSENTGFCVGQNGTLLKTTNGGEPIGIQSISNEIPKSFSLSQNYPNPFNPVTKIKFQIAELCDVKLIIYDVMGRQIETLINRQLSPNTYEAEWDASNSPSGVYFYRLTAGDYSDTKKMVLIK